MFCRSLFVLLYFFFWLMCCLFFDIRILITPLVSSNSSIDLLKYIQSMFLSSCNRIKTFDFSTFYTTVPHSKLKDRLSVLVQLCFIKKNGQRRYKYLVPRTDRFYFVKTTLILPTDFQQTVGIPMGTTVFLSSPTCSFICVRQTSYRGFSRKTKKL